MRHAGTVRVYAVRLSERASSALMAFLRSRCKARRQVVRRAQLSAGMNACAAILGGCIEADATEVGTTVDPAPRRRQSGRLTGQLHSPQTLRRETTDVRPIHRDRHADMDLSATYMIWRSDVICCKTPETTPRRAEPSGALWTYRAQTAIISTALAVCV